MNTKEKVSPDNLTEVEMSCNGIDHKCPCCGNEELYYNDWDFEEDWAKQDWSCQDCNSEGAVFYKIDRLHIYVDNHHTYNKWVAENRDKQIEEIFKD